MAKNKFLKNWASLFFGKFKVNPNVIIFEGGIHNIDKETRQRNNIDLGREFPIIGLLLNDLTFKGGEISAEIEFEEVDNDSMCEIVIYHDVSTGYMITAGLGGTLENMYTIRNRIDKTIWNYPAFAGTRDNLEKKKKYFVQVKVKGSVVELYVDKVKVLSYAFPFTIPASQIGLWCINKKKITISKFEADINPPKVFVIIPFTSPYLEMYEQVIKKIAEVELKLEVTKADEQYFPGQIIEDIEREISESSIVIADVSSDPDGKFNPNVYYEVGFARAKNKSPILLAEKSTGLPFDIRGFRTIFYKDSIIGRDDLEDKLRKFIKEILDRGLPI